MNITRGEWAEKEAEIRAAMTARYPWLVKGGGKGLRFENRAGRREANTRAPRAGLGRPCAAGA